MSLLLRVGTLTCYLQIIVYYEAYRFNTRVSRVAPPRSSGGVTSVAEWRPGGGQHEDGGPAAGRGRHRGQSSASKSSIRRVVITEKAPTRAFSWLKAATTAFTFKTLLRHFAKQALTPRSLNVKLGPRCNYHKGRAIRHYANQTARPF